MIKFGIVAQVILIVWTIAEYLLLFGLLSLVGILNDLSFWYYPLAAAFAMFFYLYNASHKKDN